jgi:hypothetical protein
MATERMNAWRVYALVAVAVVAVVNIIFAVLQTPPVATDSVTTPIDPATEQERRFSGLRHSVVVRGLHGTVGYVADFSADQLPTEPRRTEDYYLAQFALVPLILDPHFAPYDWAVTNLRSSTPAASVPAGWRIAEDFGGGVFLLRKVGQ